MRYLKTARRACVLLIVGLVSWQAQASLVSIDHAGNIFPDIFDGLSSNPGVANIPGSYDQAISTDSDDNTMYFTSPARDTNCWAQTWTGVTAPVNLTALEAYVTVGGDRDTDIVRFEVRYAGGGWECVGQIDANDFLTPPEAGLAGTAWRLARVTGTWDNVDIIAVHCLVDGRSYWDDGPRIGEILAMPEPATLGLLALGGLLASLRKRR